MNEYYAELYDAGNLTEPTFSLEDPVAVSYLAEGDGRNGAGSLTIVKGSMPETLYAEGRLVKVYRNGTPLGWFEISNHKSKTISVDEAEIMTVEVSGAGLLSWAEHTIVYPENMPTQYLGGADRMFSFASKQGSWYKTADWVVPVRNGQVHKSGPWALNYPEGFPPVTAYWIWDRDQSAAGNAPDGEVYFRREFNVSGQTFAKVFVAVDDWAVVIVDGQVIASLTSRTNHKEATVVEVNLTPGDHVLAVHARQRYGGGNNPAGLALVMVRGNNFMEDSEYTDSDVIFYSGDPQWKMNPYPTEQPGWTIGQVLTALFDEAEERGSTRVTLLSRGWSDANDVDGVSWGDARDMSVPIGSKYSEILALIQANYAEVWVDPNLTLNIAKNRGKNRTSMTTAELSALMAQKGFPLPEAPPASAPVSLEAGSSITNADMDSSAEIANHVLMRSSTAYTEHNGPATSTTKFGRREVYLNVDSPAASTAVDRTVKQTFYKYSAPTQTPTFEIIANNFQPFEDYNVGDWVEVFESDDSNASPVPRRVMSISVSLNDDGSESVVIEFDSIYDETDSRMARWIENPHGSLSGGIIADAFENTFKEPFETISGPQDTPGTRYDSRPPEAPVIGVVQAGTNWFGGRLEGEITANFTHSGDATNGRPVGLMGHQVYYRKMHTNTWHFLTSAPYPAESASHAPISIYDGSGNLNTYEVRVRTISVSGVPSAWSDSRFVTMADDKTPPPQPRPPLITPKLGTFGVLFDGYDTNDSYMPRDFDYAMLEASQSEEGPWSSTIKIHIEEIGVWVPPEYGVWYFRLIAVDHSDNHSVPSVVVSSEVRPLVEAPDIQAELDRIDRETGGLITEAQELNDRLAENKTELEAHDGLIKDLNEVKLPQLQSELDANEAIVNTLKDTTIPALNSRLDDAEGELDTTRTELNSRLDQAETDIDNAESNLNNLNTVTIPELNTRLDNAQTEIDTNQTELTNRLDDAFLDIGAAQDTADGAATAASNAQSAADSAKDYAEAQVALLISQGQNLVRNGDFEMDTIGWPFKTSSGVQLDTTVARSGTNSTKLGPNVNNSYIESDYIPTSGSRSYYLEYWAKREAGTPPASGVGFVYRRVFPNNSTTVTGVSTLSISEISTTEWTKVSQTITIPSTETLEIRFGPWWQSPSGGSGLGIWVDDFLAVDVTEAQEALNAAADAQARADSAHSLAGTAQSRADAAYTMAGSKNAVYYSSSEPSGTGTSAGDLWRRRNSSREIIGEWQWTGSAWEKQTVSGSNVSNMDIGYLTAGSANISEAVVDKLWADVITARKIVASQVLIGQGGNELIDPSFNDFNIRVARQADMGAGWYWSQYNGQWTAARATDNVASTWRINNGAPDDLGDYIPVTADTEYAFTVDASGTYDVFYSILYDTGAVGYPGEFISVSDSNTARRTATYTQKFGDWRGSGGQRVVAVLPTIRSRASDNFIRVYGVRFSAMSDGSLIVNGSISGDHLEVNSVAAKVATVMKLDVGKLTASSATINTGVINKLWTDVVRARKITTDMLLVGGNGDNLIADPLFTNSALNAHRQQIVNSVYDAGWYWTGSYWYSRSGVADGQYRMWFPNNLEPAGASAYDAPVTPGVTYRFQVDAFVSGGTATLQATMRTKNQDGGTSYFFLDGSFSATSGWATVEWEWTPDANHAFAMPELVFTSVKSATRLAVRKPSFKAKVDGSLVVAGSITGDHLEVNSVSAKVASVIKLNANTITSGTINTARLNTSAIAAATASIQKADVSNLTVSDASISQAVIDKLWADVIHAKKITSDMLIIGAGNNLIPNARLTSTDGWSGWGRNASNGPDGQPSIWGLGRKNLLSSSFDLEPGKRYRFEVQAMAQKTGSRIYVQINTDGDANPYVVNNEVVPTSWKSYSGEFEAPAGATSGQVNVYLNHPNGSSTDGYQWFTGWGLFPMASGELIVDGAITSGKIYAGSVTAGKIATNAVTADKILAGAVTAAKIDADAVTADSIASGAVRADHIYAGAVTSAKLHSDAITGKTITGGSIIGSKYRFNGSDAGSGYDMRIDGDIYGSYLGWSVPGGLVQGTLRAFDNDPWAEYSAPALVMRAPSKPGWEYRAAVKISAGSTENNGLIDMTGNVWIRGQLRGRYQVTDTSGSFTSIQINDLTSGYTGESPTIKSLGMYNRVYTFSSNMYITSNGYIGRTTSLRSSKLAIEDLPENQIDALLDVPARWWFDRSHAEALAKYTSAVEGVTPEVDPESVEDVPADLSRIPGLVAEEVEEAGATAFLTYDRDDQGNRKLSGVAYDRVGAALLPIVKRQRDKIAELEKKFSELAALVKGEAGN